jgi:hypothetical protein
LKNNLDIIDRLEAYMNYKGLNDNQVTVQSGLSIGLIGKARKTRKGLHSDSIEKILHTYSDLSPCWFTIGTGNMLVEDKPSMIQNKGSGGSCKICEEKDKRIDDLNKQVEKLYKVIEKLTYTEDGEQKRKAG